MADILPEVTLGTEDDGRPVVLVGEDGEAHDMGALLRLAPALAGPAHAALLAETLNHFAHGDEYRLIADPSAYAKAYRARLAREAPDVPFQEGVVRLRDYGVPDFDEIKPPSFDSGALRFFAEDSVLGLPYVVEAADLTAEPSYEPLELDPLPSVPEMRGEEKTKTRQPGFTGDAGVRKQVLQARPAKTSQATKD
jgi:hypothetical protein